MTTITTPSSLALVPSLKTAWHDVDSGLVEKSGRDDSVIASDSPSPGAGHAGTQGAGSTGAAHHWLATTAHS
jgi:hypothetical protein